MSLFIGHAEILLRDGTSYAFWLPQLG